MKKYSILLAALVSLTLTACFDDDSTDADYNRVGEITVTGIDEAYTKIAYTGDHLQISPTITTTDAESDLSYQWLLLNTKTGTLDTKGDTIQPEVIGTDRNLDYEVATTPGTYQVRLLVSQRSTGYTVYATTSLTVQTAFSQGFYVLKETTDGNTDIDELSAVGTTGENLLLQTQGAPMSGKPGAIYTEYNLDYVDPESLDPSKGNMLLITTADGHFQKVRTTDLRKIFDRSNILFGTMDATEKVYAAYETPMDRAYLLTSSGFRYTTPNGKTTGQYGNPIPETDASSLFAIDMPSYGNTLFWDAANHNLTTGDYNGNLMPLTYTDLSGEDKTQGLSGWQCLHMGYNLLSSDGVFTTVMEDPSGQRYVYLTDVSFSSTYLSAILKAGADSHLAKATSFSTNGNQAKYIYCVDGGKLYAVNYSDESLPEIPLTLQGIPSGETINFVTNQYWGQGSDAFDYLIVGTQQGTTYHLYFYEMNGGAPQGAPVKTMQGTGTVKHVRYLNTNLNNMYLRFGFNMYSITD